MLLWTPRCAGCDRPGVELCRTCRFALIARPTTPAPEGVIAGSAFTGRVRDVLLGFKYGNRRAVAGHLGGIVVNRLVAAGVRPDVVTWAPTSAGRRRARGFDQAELVARQVARQFGVPCRRLLERDGPDRPQTGQGRRGRLHAPAFRAHPARPGRTRGGRRRRRHHGRHDAARRARPCWPPEPRVVTAAAVAATPPRSRPPSPAPRSVRECAPRRAAVRWWSSADDRAPTRTCMTTRPPPPPPPGRCPCLATARVACRRPCVAPSGVGADGDRRRCAGRPGRARGGWARTAGDDELDRCAAGHPANRGARPSPSRRPLPTTDVPFTLPDLTIAGGPGEPPAPSVLLTVPDLTIPDTIIVAADLADLIPAATEPPSRSGRRRGTERSRAALSRRWSDRLRRVVHARTAAQPSYEAYADTCAGRQDEGTSRFCARMVGLSRSRRRPDRRALRRAQRPAGAGVLGGRHGRVRHRRQTGLGPGRRRHRQLLRWASRRRSRRLCHGVSPSTRRCSTPDPPWRMAARLDMEGGR